MPLLDFGPVAIQLATPSFCDAWAEPLRRYLALNTHHSSPWRLHVSEEEKLPTHLPFTYQRVALRFCADPVQRTAWVYVGEEQADVMAAVELVLTLAIHQLGGLCVHASAGVVAGKGFLMPGPSGTGKSTSVNYGGFEKVIGDERIILLPENGDWMMYSTPFWSKGRATTPRPERHTLTSILVLRKGQTIRTSPLTQLDVLRCLMRNTVHYGTAEGQSNTIFDRCTRISAQCAGHEVMFTKKGPWAWQLNQMLT